MSIYLYSLTEAHLVRGRAWPAGVRGTPVTAIESAGLALIGGEVDRLPEPVTRAALLQHNAVNLAVMSTGACVPFRYGTMLPELEQCRALVADRAEHWHRALDRLRGKVELSVKVVVPRPAEERPADVAGVGPGTRYLRLRRGALRQEAAAQGCAEEVAGALCEYLGTLAAATLVEARGRLVMVSVLLEDKAFETAIRGIRQLAEHVEGRWAISDRWPPYSFVEERPVESIVAPRRHAACPWSEDA